MDNLTEREQGLIILLICLVITAVVFTWNCIYLYNEGAMPDQSFSFFELALAAIVSAVIGGGLYSATLFVLIVMPLFFFINRKKNKRSMGEVDIDFLPKLFPICIIACFVQYMVFGICIPFSIMVIGY